MTYDAFISYSHAADNALAPALQKALQRFAKPWNKRRALYIFRDDTGLAVSPTLWSSIQAALDSSRYFVLLASPDAAKSQWVNREIEHWLSQKRPGEILPVLTDGEWRWDDEHRDFDPEYSESVPAALRGVFKEEPRYLDLRWAREKTQLDLRHSGFRKAVAELAAPLHGVPKDELEGEDIRMQRHARRLAQLAVATLVLLSVLASAFGFLAQRNAQRATERERLAEARRLAAESRNQLDDRYDLALLLAVESVLAHDEAPTVESRASLLTALTHKPRLATFLPGQRWSGGGVEEVAFSPDGNLLAAGGWSGSVLMWRKTQSAWALHAEIDIEGAVTGLAFGPKGRQLAVSSSIGDVSLWNTESGEPTGVRIRNPTAVMDVAFVPGRDLLATADEGGALTLWNAQMGEESGARLIGHREAVLKMGFSPGGDLVATASDDGTLMVWDIDHRRRHIGPLRGHQKGDLGFNSVASLAFAPDGKILFSGGADGTIRRWNLASGAELGEPIRADQSVVWGLAAAPSGRLIASGGHEGIRIWSTETWEPVWPPLFAKRGGSSALAFHPSGTLLASGGSSLTLWDLSRANALSNGGGAYAGRSTLAASPAGGMLASGGSDGAIVLWRPEDGAVRSEFLVSPGGAPIDTMSFRSDGQLLASVVDGGRIAVTDVATGRPFESPRRLPHAQAVAFSPATPVLAIVTTEGELLLWDTASDALRGAPIYDEGTLVSDVAFSPDGLTVATAALRERTVALWDLHTLEPVRDPIHVPGPTHVTFSPSGGTLLSAGVDGSISVIDLGGDQNLGEPTLMGHSGYVAAVAFAPSGDFVAAGGDDGTLILWSGTSWQRLAQLDIGNAATIWALAFSSDGQELGVAQEDGDVTFLDMSLDSWREAACSGAGRNLTRNEWTQFVSDRSPRRPTCKERPLEPPAPTVVRRMPSPAQSVPTNGIQPRKEAEERRAVLQELSQLSRSAQTEEERIAILKVALDKILPGSDAAEWYGFGKRICSGTREALKEAPETAAVYATAWSLKIAKDIQSPKSVAHDAVLVMIAVGCPETYERIESLLLNAAMHEAS